MPTVLITGATGLIGSELLRRVLSWSPGLTVALLVRPRGRRSPDERVGELLAELFPASSGPPPPRTRLRIVPGDLAAPGLGLSPRAHADLAADLVAIHHLGADVRFDLPLDDARAINVEGARALADLAVEAVRHGEFERFHHISTFAASGRAPGRALIPEAPPVLAREFRNTYEQTKAEAELALLERAGEVPLTIHRAGIVVGDSRNGWTSKFDVFYMLFRLLLDDVDLGFPLERVPVPSRARVNALTIDFVADALYALGSLQRGDSGEILHFTAGASASFSADALEAGMAHFARYLGELGRRVPALPELIRLDDLSPEGAEAVLGSEYAPAILDIVGALMPYGFDDAVYDNRALLAALAATPLRPRPLEADVARIIEYPLRSAWGTIPEDRPPLGTPPV